MLTIAIVACMAFSVVSCSGNKAISAYEIAVKNGFVGTEAEWLASLKGANGKDAESFTIEDLYEAAKAEGFQGSLLDFIHSLGSDLNVQENNDTQMIANNVTSVVSVYCGFSEVTTSGGLFGGQQTTTYYASGGSGVILDIDKESGNALIVTNYHVLYNLDSREKISNNIYVYGYGDILHFNPEPNGEKGGGIPARFVGGAMDYDVALLRVEGKVEALKNKTAAVIGSSDDLKLGEKVFAIGNPKGGGISVTTGIISVDSEYIEMLSPDERRTLQFRVMRTDTPTNKGNSGGALFDVNGELIGITNAKHGSTEVENIAYALPISKVIKLCENIMDNGGKTNNGVVKRAVLGSTYSIISSSGVIDGNGDLRIVETVAISEAASRGKAAYQKFRVGDVLLSMQINNGEKIAITRLFQVDDYLLNVRLGDKVHFEVRNATGNTQTVTIHFNDEGYFTTYS